MADARWSVIAVVCAVAARAAAIGQPCEEERGRTGLALKATEQGLTVGGVEDDSAAAAAGLHVGDTVVQVNGTVPRACADYGRTVHEAERERKAVLMLVRRGDTELALVLGARTWDRPLPAVPPPPKAEAPTVRAMVEKPAPPLPPAAHVTLDELLQGFAALVPPDRPPTRLATYQHDLLKLHRQTEALADRAAVPAEVTAGLRTVLRYYDAAEVAWSALETEHQREQRPRHLPTSEGETLAYFGDSEAAATIEEFPFLGTTVTREPHPALIAGESSGLWRPLQARSLLWEHARVELGRLSSWLATR